MSTGPGGQAPRSCGTCSLCCKLLEIASIDKPAGKWCPDCAPPNGCSVYDRRPEECRGFSCGWLEIPGLGEAWKPQRCKIVLFSSDGGSQLTAVVDPAAPDAWRKQPFYDQLKAWSGHRHRSGPDVLVRIGSRVIAILPDRDIDLGEVEGGERVLVERTMTPSGPKHTARVVPAEGSRRS